MGSRILIVEDEKNLGDTLTEYLGSLGHQISLSGTCESARNSFNDFDPQIILMDIGLPDGDGIELAKELREKSKNFVLIFLSAQNDPETRLLGLEIGADDYITKPFQLKELVLRLDRISAGKTNIDSGPPVYTFGEVCYWPNRFEIKDGVGDIHNLSLKEANILTLLIKNMGKVVSRDQIIEEVWGSDSFPSNRTVDNYIVKLRKWSDSEPNGKVQIQSVRGVGYKLLKN
ncbi:MAG: response regulator transcription factor [Bacteriovoracaceae bacterium]|nr:response regulator transcription factor [Bacteriovoracaceae bacterium]